VPRDPRARSRRRLFSCAGALLGVLAGAGAPPTEPPAPRPRHLIYLHGRIVQEAQSERPRHPEYGVYQLDAIAAAFRARGLTVRSEIRPRGASVDASADRVVGEVRALLSEGVRADEITVVGASMGASIAFAAAARLANPELRFVTLGACLSANVEAVRREEGRAPAGRLLAIREASDELTSPCAPWREDPDSAPGLSARELVIATGLGHGFLYRPLPDWFEPAAAWARGATHP
jgi:pimeloyl-ACP methyl ester carboxylesterase